MSGDGYTLSGYKLGGKELEAILGPLEADVLNVVYEMEKPVKVREVYEKMKRERKIAYTTIMSTMNTLFEKGLLDRRIVGGRGGHLYVYWPKMSRTEIERSAVKQIIDSLVKNFGEAVTLYLVDMKTPETGEKKKTS